MNRTTTSIYERVEALEKAYISMPESIRSNLGDILLKPNQEGHPYFEIGEYALISIPERAEDGGYIISIVGDFIAIIENGVDVIAHRYDYHRISERNEPVKLTHEWKGGAPYYNAMDALNLIASYVSKHTSR